jgi:hypothetical protein
MTRRLAVPMALVAAIAGILVPARAQQSASYRLADFVVNEGGHPIQAIHLASSSFHLKIDSVGEGLVGATQQSTSFRSEAGFVSGYPPPGEVRQLLYPDRTTMVWRTERSVGTYNVYRDLVSSLPALGFGACFARALPGATASEPGDPPSDSGWFYLVTAENRLREEGTKGNRSNGISRGNPDPCP